MNDIHPVPAVPPPWILQADSWVFPFWHSLRSPNLPSGSYHPMESIEEDGNDDMYKGGPGAWLLYRYSDSPVGPYDELILVAGTFTSLGLPTGLRITNIYVSSEESIYNGRRNWNIPKHKAHFEWSHDVHTNSCEAQTVSVYNPETTLPGELGSAFFSATLHPFRFCPNIPLNTTYSFLPSLFLYQPALLPSKYDRGSRQAMLAAQTNDFIGVIPTFTGSFHLASLSLNPNKKEYGDGVYFPRFPAGFLTVGFHFPKVEVGFPKPVHFKRKDN